MSEREYTAVVLAGGVGSRLKPLTTHRPKPLVPIANWTMLDYALFLLKKNAGIKKAVIVVKYLGKQIREYIGDGSRYGMEIIIPECDPLDTADAVRKVGEYINGPFIVTMADIVTSIDLKDFIRFHEAKKGIASISLKSINQPKSFGVILLSTDDEILLFLEKPLARELYVTTLAFSRRKTVHLEANLVNTGMYIFEENLLQILKNFDDLMDFGKHVFPFILQQKKDKIFGYMPNYEYYWMDCGTPQKYLWANTDVLRRWSWPYLPRGNEPQKDYWIGDGVNIHQSTIIDKPVSIGSNTIIGENTTIRRLSNIGDDCNIGNNVSIEYSVIWENVTIDDDCEIEGSIICNGAVIKEGVKLSGCIIEKDTVIDNDCGGSIKY
ncbi:MAG: sugar phosphate nucleotidyltransferase [Candidatus Hodarchaeales archaeon]|jgi:NDP-sugar pyrophosphorylase family protein